MADELRSQKHPVGIAGVSASEIERQVGADEASPLPPNAKLRCIGRSTPRINGRAKVTGQAAYTVDVRLPGMLHARILRSPYPHARILALDTQRAEGHSGVRAVHVIDSPIGRATEIIGPAAAAPQSRSLLYAGDPIAAVAAVTAQDAQSALDLIEVDYEPLPFVIDIEDARKIDAPRVFERAVRTEFFGGPAPQLPQHGNVHGPNTSGSRGDAAAGLNAADIVVEGEFQTQVQTHCCLEPHALVADWHDDGLTVYMSTQFTAGIRAELAETFGLPLSRVRVVVDAMGGGFGSKSRIDNYVLAAVRLSRKANAPVRLVLDRHEEQIDGGNRPSTVQHIRAGARRDGTLTGVAIDAYGTAGVALGAGVGNFAQSIYECANFALVQSDVFINAGPGCAMRAPGNVPGAFAYEQIIDELSEKLGIDPIALRNHIDPSPVRREERRVGAERFGWSRRQPPGSDSGVVKRGLGMAQSYWPALIHTNSSCEVRILRDGSVEVLSSVQDIGTGIGTVLAQVVAEELGLTPQDIAVRIGDTDFPAGPPSYGSRTTASITPPARNAAYQALRKLIETVAPSLGTTPESLIARAGRISTADGGRSIGFREAAAQLPTEQVSAVASRSDDYGGFGHRMGDAALARNGLGGVQFAEVTVDTETGRVRIERVLAVHDCGRPMNPLQIESQVQGGILQGISYALFEERILDSHTGHVLNPNLEQYRLLRSRETPAIEVHLLENYQGASATDAYGIAEPSTIATAPAIANAVYNAIGVRMRTLPMTPAVILAALGRLPHRSGPP
jgi:xanthine dehydrogenase YagR molybdenum-binding subunit